MQKNPEIDRLKEASNRTFSAKQVAYGRMKPLGQQRHDFKNQMDISWGKVISARNEMNSVYERQQDEWKSYRNERELFLFKMKWVGFDGENRKIST